MGFSFILGGSDSNYKKPTTFRGGRSRGRPCAALIRRPVPTVGFRQLARYATVERCVLPLVLLLQTECRALQSVQDVAEVQLRDRAYGFRKLGAGFSR